MQEQLLSRIQALIEQGLVVTRSGSEYWVDDVARAQAWMASTANVIQQIAPTGSFYRQEMDRLATHPDLKNGIPTTVIQKVFGVLRSVQDEAKEGLVAKIEYQVFATAFDDFLDHAAEFHKSGKAKEAAVLVSAVFEDTLKRVALKNGLTPSGVSLDPLIDELTRLSVFTPVKAKRMKSFAGVRNSALHAEWEKLDLKDIGNAIDGVRELLDDYL